MNARKMLYHSTTSLLEHEFLIASTALLVCGVVLSGNLSFIPSLFLLGYVTKTMGFG